MSPVPDNSSAADLVSTYSDILFRFAIVRVNNRELAQDLVQDTLLSALKNRESLKTENVKSWLFSILKNRIIDYYRKKKSLAFSDVLGEEDEDDDFFDKKGHWKKGVTFTDWHTNPEASSLHLEFIEVVKQCLSKMGEAMRTAFVMKHIDEYKSDQICKELGITPSNYWVILHRAKLSLRTCVEKKYR